jgi:PKD repeat protein
MGNASDIGVYESGSAPNPVKVSATGSPKYGIAPLNVSFTANATGGTQPYTWSWEFGDGQSSTQQNLSHQYVAAGTYKANVTATDSSSQKLKGSATLTITVNGSIPVVTSVTIYPKSVKMNSTNWVEFFARALDQNGNQLKSGVAWSWTLSPINIGWLNSSIGYNLTRFAAGNASLNGSISVSAKMDSIAKSADASISVTWCDCRAKPPFVNITRPNDQEAVNGTITIITEVSSSVLKVEFYVDGTQIGVDQNPLFKYDWDTRTVSDGQHKIKVIAYNATGGQASDEITVNVDNHPNGGGGGGTGKSMDQTLIYASIVIAIVIVVVLILIALLLRRKKRPTQKYPEF